MKKAKPPVFVFTPNVDTVIQPADGHVTNFLAGCPRATEAFIKPGRSRIIMLVLSNSLDFKTLFFALQNSSTVNLK